MSRWGKVATIVVFSLLYFLTRLPRLGTTIVNTDEVYWHTRSRNFLNAIESKNYEKTFQKYHPGVPLMWEMSIAARITSLSQNKTVTEVFNDFELIHSNTQLLMIIWFFILSILLIFLLSGALDNWWVSVLSVTILTLEPFYVGNARLIHHDGQISLYVAVALSFIYLFCVKKRNIFYIVFGALFLALAALSKTLFTGAFVFCLFAGSFFTLIGRGYKKTLIFILVMIIGFISFYIALFPAMWVNPRGTVEKIISESYEVGAEEGHRQIFFGEETRDPGPTFYPILIWLKTSPFVVFGMAAYFIWLIYDSVLRIKSKKYWKLKEASYILFAGIFYLGYFAIITYFSKKVWRYIIPFYPYFALLATYGWGKFLNIKKNLLWIVPVITFSLSVGLKLYTVFPNYLVYTNPLVGNAKDANEIIGQRIFGVGVFDLRDKIIKRYGSEASVGMSDYRTFASIYPNGKVYDVLVEHPNSFKVMVLGSNKDFPISMQKDPSIRYKQVDSIVVDGLEIWRIYERVP